MNIQSTNYSFLFSSFGSNNSSSNATNLNFLSDYASIKNGSYAKLMKAYYNSGNNKSVSSSVSNKNNNTVTDVEQKDLTKVQTATDALKESADTLLVNGSKSVFAKKEVTTKDENGVESKTEEYDVAGIYKAVNDFVTNYNSVINAVNDADNEKVTNRATSMVNNTAANLNLLNKVGITMNEDCTLSIDKDKFNKANMTTVKSLFSGNFSYAYRVSSQASMIDSAAEREASRNNTYTVNGTLNNSYNSGNLFNTLF